MTPIFALMAPLLLATVTTGLQVDSPDLGAIKVNYGTINAASKAGTGTEAFFAVSNAGPDPDTLTGLSCPDADVTSLVDAHGKPMSNVPIPPGQTVTFAANGPHLVLQSLHFPVRYGTVVPCTVSFAVAGDVQMLLFSNAPRS